MPIRRRHLLQVPAALALTSAAAATRAATAAADPAAREPSIDKDSGASPGVPGPLPLDLDPEALRWLDRLAPPAHAGVAWGWPWPRGQVRRGQAFALRDGDGRLQALQGWPLAWWPDGSMK